MPLNNRVSPHCTCENGAVGVPGVPCQGEATSHSLCLSTIPGVHASPNPTLLCFHWSEIPPLFAPRMLRVFMYNIRCGLWYFFYSWDFQLLISLIHPSNKCLLSTYLPALRSALYEVQELNANRTAGQCSETFSVTVSASITCLLYSPPSGRLPPKMKTAPNSS